MEDVTMEAVENCTACQLYGHQYVQDEENPNRRTCLDCGEYYEEEPA